MLDIHRVAFHLIFPRETLAFRSPGDIATRGAVCLPLSSFLDVGRGVMGWVFGILYGCPVIDLPLSGSFACG
jgi:hypothetical protein